MSKSHPDIETSVPQDQSVKKRLRDYELPFLHHLTLMVMSGAVAFSSFIPLFLKELTTSLQFQAQYIGFAFSQGQVPYAQVFSKEGFLFHGLSGLANHYGGTYWLILGQLFAFYLSGLFLHKVLSLLTQRQAVGLKGAKLFYLFNVIFGFGGFYAIQLAFPFIMMGLWFMMTYLTDYRRDEGFIKLGVEFALSIALSPISLYFWLLLLTCLVVVNARRQRWARGCYQFLATLFGSIWILYPLGYFIFNFQMAMPYVEQTLLGQVTLSWSDQMEAYLAMAIMLMVAVCSGLLTGLILLPVYAKKLPQQLASLILLSLSTLVYVTLAILKQSIHLPLLLPALPFALCLTLLYLEQASIPSSELLSRRRLKTPTTVQFHKKHAYLPMLVLIASLFGLVYRLITTTVLVSERTQIAAHVVAETGDDDRIYTWDDSAQIYLDSRRLSASQFPLATVYTDLPARKSLLVDELLQGRARYIIVNRSLPLPAELAKKLQNTYEEVELEAVDHFIIYRAK